MSAKSGKEEESRQVLSDLQEELLQLEPGRPIPSHFNSPSLVEFLLQESEELQADVAESAVFWADLAFHLADALRNKRFLACDAMARASRLKGNAFRLDGGLEAADRAFALGWESWKRASTFSKEYGASSWSGATCRRSP